MAKSSPSKWCGMTWLKDAQGALEVQLQLFQFFPAARLQQANKMNKTSWLNYLNSKLWVRLCQVQVTPLNQWEFQDPKMEVLYHIRPLTKVEKGFKSRSHGPGPWRLDEKTGYPHDDWMAPHWVDSGSVHVLHLAAAPESQAEGTTGHASILFPYDVYYGASSMLSMLFLFCLLMFVVMTLWLSPFCIILTTLVLIMDTVIYYWKLWLLFQWSFGPKTFLQVMVIIGVSEDPPKSQIYFLEIIDID